MQNESLTLDERIALHNKKLEEVLPQEGEWNKEPNRVEWEHKGLPCLAQRNHLGAWCGYVAVKKNHLYFGKHYDSVVPSPDVHGGLTYASECQGIICHGPEEKEEVWWFGFDCSHYMDLTPGVLKYRESIKDIPELKALNARLSFSDPSEVYRDIHYVKSEVEKLAEQLYAIEH